MAVYVDQLSHTNFQGWIFGPHSHLMADTDSELDEMAARLGLNPDWKHRDHFDLTIKNRHRALALGAIETTARNLVELRRRQRGVVPVP